MARPVRDEGGNRRGPAGSVGRSWPSGGNIRRKPADSSGHRHRQRPGRPDAGPAFPRSAGNGHRQRCGGSGPGPGKFHRLPLAAEAKGRPHLPPGILPRYRCHSSLQEFCRGTAATAAARRFDLIVSNPPFYDTTLTSPDPLRTAARHTGGLTHEELLLLSAGLLSDTGVFSLIVPSESEKSILRLADRSRLHLHRLTRVYSKPSSRPRRILASFGRQQLPQPLEDSLTLTDTDGTRSPEHIRLTRDFYLEY